MTIPQPGQTTRLNQKVALVTSSSPGLSAQVAQQLAREGAKVMLCGRNAAQGLATVRTIRDSGGRATFFLADIAASVDVQAAIDETIATYGRLDILFNYASSQYPRDGAMLEVSEAVWDRVVESMLKGTFLCCQYALPFLQQSGSGTIINLIEKPSGSKARSVSAICQGGVLAMTGAIAQQFPASTVTANLIWAIHPLAASELANLEPDSLDQGNSRVEDRASYEEDLPTMSLFLDPILYGPLACDRPFTDIDEAVMYLACHGSELHGAALVVKRPSPNSSMNPAGEP